MSSLNCFSCRKENTLVVGSVIGRGDECSHCGADLHVCKNCEFYDPKSYNECRERSADVVREKDRSNFCDFFSPRKGAFGAAAEKEKMMSAAEALFKKK